MRNNLQTITVFPALSLYDAMRSENVMRNVKQVFRPNEGHLTKTTRRLHSHTRPTDTTRGGVNAFDFHRHQRSLSGRRGQTTVRVMDTPTHLVHLAVCPVSDAFYKLEDSCWVLYTETNVGLSLRLPVLPVNSHLQGRQINVIQACHSDS